MLKNNPLVTIIPINKDSLSILISKSKIDHST